MNGEQVWEGECLELPNGASYLHVVPFPLLTIDIPPPQVAVESGRAKIVETEERKWTVNVPVGSVHVGDLDYRDSSMRRVCNPGSIRKNGRSMEVWPGLPSSGATGE